MDNERILKFTVGRQIVSKYPDCDFSGIVKGSEGYLMAMFVFSREWYGCKIAASFWSNGKEYAVPVQNGKCIIPSEALKGDQFYVSLVGIRKGYKITTNKFKVSQEG